MPIVTGKSPSILKCLEYSSIKKKLIIFKIIDVTISRKFFQPEKKIRQSIKINVHTQKNKQIKPPHTISRELA